MFNKFYCFVADQYFKKLTKIPPCSKMAAATGAKRKREEEEEGSLIFYFDLLLSWGKIGIIEIWKPCFSLLQN